MICLFVATMLAAQSIQLGINEIVVAGGMENMSNAPKYIAESRSVYIFVLFPTEDVTSLINTGLIIWKIIKDLAVFYIFVIKFF